MTASQVLIETTPMWIAMLGLLGLSAFFSSSEAALFSLRGPDRSALAAGNRAQRQANELLDDPDRLLSAVLFWNLVVNLTYFLLASQISIRMHEVPRIGPALFAAFSSGALLVIIFFSELLPKSFAVLNARQLAAWVSLPLSLTLRLVDPVLPTLRLINLLSRRLIWPSFAPENYLQLDDIERAITLSTQDANLLEREQQALRNLLSLSELRVDECMCPRSRLTRFQPPVRWHDVTEELPEDGMVYVTEPKGDEIVSFLDLHRMSEFPADNLERYATEIEYVPWSSKAADVLQALSVRDQAAVAVVNEQGETIGVVRRKDLLDLVFTLRPSRSERLLNQSPVQPVTENCWKVTGLSNLRTLAEYFQCELPESAHVTVAGVVQECLQRLPATGDVCIWGPFRLEVIEDEADEPIVVYVQRIERTEDSP